jgi:hypothetical protein
VLETENVLETEDQPRIGRPSHRTATPMNTNNGHTAPRPCAAAWAMTALGAAVVVGAVLFTR